MTSTTIDSSTPTTDPFETARKKAAQREEEMAAEAARQAELNRLQREQQQLQRAAAEALARAVAEEREFRRQAHQWVTSFLFAVAKEAEKKQWTVKAIDTAKAYAEALVRRSDVDLPKIDPYMAKLIQSKFAYGIVLDHNSRNIIPENFFNGQRQDWFPALYERKLTTAR